MDVAGATYLGWRSKNARIKVLKKNTIHIQLLSVLAGKFVWN